MARRPYRFTPARRAALAKAQKASAKSRKTSAGVRHSKSLGKSAARGFISGGPAGAAAAVGTKATGIVIGSAKRRVRKTVKPFLPKSLDFNAKTPNRAGRGVGLGGLKRNTIPYARVNRRGATAGINAGTIIPGTGKRIVVGGYGRVENIRNTKLDKAIAGNKAKFIPIGSRRAKAVSVLRRHGVLKNPALRANVYGAQARLGTSRKGGATIIVRRGSHKTTRTKSKAGVARYDKRMGTIAGRKARKPRPQRRKKAGKRK